MTTYNAGNKQGITNEFEPAHPSDVSQAEDSVDAHRFEMTDFTENTFYRFVSWVLKGQQE
ncbi:hypothetical protein GCM10008018_11110 [Paenibacillus marchantiophytorum]|uniref:Uncharacterized protein n=1 Tax=Paenibacillus marchantiophytorum TaxID=1619310 RepID=A0ABQ2BSM8_9BACL|nr:hypothetical protein [Paenibacillus marchantiophytorum]GGI45241.1 hypothetical protein GCM10008018_11110 [Paenibacillus marchantiophytorum]